MRSHRDPLWQLRERALGTRWRGNPGQGKFGVRRRMGYSVCLSISLPWNTQNVGAFSPFFEFTWPHHHDRLYRQGDGEQNSQWKKQKHKKKEEKNEAEEKDEPYK